MWHHAYAEVWVSVKLVWVSVKLVWSGNACCVYTNAGLFTFGKLTDTQTLLPWFITLSPLIQSWLPEVPYARSTHQNRHRLCVLKRKGDFQQAYLGEEGHMRLQQMVDESALFAPQTGLSFHAWLFLGGVYTQECMHWRGFPENLIHLSHVLPPRYDPRSNNQTSMYVWPHRKMVY